MIPIWKMVSVGDQRESSSTLFRPLPNTSLGRAPFPGSPQGQAYGLTAPPSLIPPRQ